MEKMSLSFHSQCQCNEKERESGIGKKSDPMMNPETKPNPKKRQETTQKQTKRTRHANDTKRRHNT
jgi:hypothetical protein